ncbi:MAG: hypothetical protein ABIN24_15570 [Dyadobacter sp.]
MKHIIEKNKINRDGANENIMNSMFHSTCRSGKHCEPVKRFKDGGYIAWPEDRLPIPKDADNEVREGRTKGGGYIAFPK